MDTYVVDTHALAWFIARSARLSRRAAEVLRKAEQGKASVLVPTVVLAELLYISERKRVPVSLTEILNRIGSGGYFQVVPFDWAVFERMMKISKALEIHDRIIVATAKVYGAKVISKDEWIKRATAIVW
jgi:predicted nucleic acid-binding protein